MNPLVSIQSLSPFNPSPSTALTVKIILSLVWMNKTLVLKMHLDSNLILSLAITGQMWRMTVHASEKTRGAGLIPGLFALLGLSCTPRGGSQNSILKVYKGKLVIEAAFSCNAGKGKRKKPVACGPDSSNPYYNTFLSGYFTLPITDLSNLLWGEILKLISLQRQEHSGSIHVCISCFAILSKAMAGAKWHNWEEFGSPLKVIKLCCWRCCHFEKGHFFVSCFAPDNQLLVPALFFFGIVLVALQNQRSCHSEQIPLGVLARTQDFVGQTPHWLVCMQLE